MFSNSVLYLAENWMWDTILFVLRNRKLEMLVAEMLPKLFMWAKFYWPTYFQSITINKKLSKSLQFTHMKLTNLTLLTSKLY